MDPCSHGLSDHLSGFVTRNRLALFKWIPMAGFTESYNISVSEAVILYTLWNRLERSGLEWKLSKEDKTMLLLEWLRTSIKMLKQIEIQYRKDNKPTF